MPLGWNRKESATTRLVARLVSGRVVWPPLRYERLAKEGYQANTWVYACVSGIATAFKGVPWCSTAGRRSVAADASRSLQLGDEAVLTRRYGRPAPGWSQRAWAIRQAL